MRPILFTMIDYLGLVWVQPVGQAIAQQVPTQAEQHYGQGGWEVDPPPGEGITPRSDDVAPTQGEQFAPL